MKTRFIYVDTDSWHSFYIKRSDILKETDKAYFIHTHDGGVDDGKGIWISKKLVRPSGNGYKVSVGNDFAIKPQYYEKKYRGVDDMKEGNWHLSISPAIEKEITNGKDFADSINELREIEKEDKLQSKMLKGTHDANGRDLRDYSELISKLESRLEKRKHEYKNLISKLEKAGIKDDRLKNLINVGIASIDKAEKELESGKKSNFYGSFKKAEFDLQNASVINKNIISELKNLERK